MTRPFASEVPAYVGVYDNLYSDLVNNVYLEGESLPSESSLAEKYGVSRNTLRQALAILVEDGLIDKGQGRETVVRQRGDRAYLGKVANPMTEMCSVPISGCSVSYNYGPPTEISETKLGLSRSDVLLAATVTCRSEEVVTGYSFVQIPVRHFESLGVDASSNQGLQQLVVEGIFQSAVRALISFKVVFSNEMESLALSVEEGTPLVLMEWMLYGAAHEAFARVKFYLRPEFYSLDFQL